MTDDEKRRLFTTLDHQTEQLNRLNLGMFGDEKLKQPGLITDVQKIKLWQLSINQRIAFGSGVFMVLGLICTKLYEAFIAFFAGKK